jgi:hypothetical protein
MLSTLALLIPALAFAQQPDAPPPPPPPPPAEEQAAPAETPPAPAVETPAEAPSTSSPEERLSTVEAKLEGLQESTAADHAVVDALKKIKVSGYIQGRYEWKDEAGAGLNAAGSAPVSSNRFRVRRARLKTTYQGTLSEFVLQIDAVPPSSSGPDGVTLKDAEASLFLDENTIPSSVPFEVRLTVGQFKVPFGFEILQSSGEREMPERSAMMGAFFPGERDRGVRLQAKFGMFRLSTAIINGNVFPALYNPTPSTPFNYTFNEDQSSGKDWAGRVGVDLGFVVVGGSWYYGRTILATNLRPASGMTAAVPVGYLRFDRLRLGADAQAYVDIPMVGGLTVRGEIIHASETNTDYAGVTADKCRDVKSLGWYGTVVQNVGDHVGLVFRVDQFNRNRNNSTPGTAEGCKSAMENASIDKVTTFGGGLLLHVSGNLKGTLVYEHIAEQGKNKKDNDVFTAQLQAKF